MSLNNETNTLFQVFRSDAKHDIYAKLDTIRNQPNAKDAAVSRAQREKAEFLLNRGKHNLRMHEKILEYCVSSIAKAPPGTEELAQAYGQRSKLMLDLRKYQECLEDITRALDITKSNTLKVELHCRMAECSIAQHMGVEKSILQEAELYLAKVDPLEAEIYDLFSKVERTKAMLEEPLELYQDLQPMESRTPVHPTTSAVRIEHSEKYGRHLVAARDIHPGELVIVEPIHAGIRNMKHEIFRLCYHCLSMSWTLIPCDDCDEVLFCSDVCKQEAMAKYHDIECPIIMALKGMKDEIDENVYLALKIVIMAIKEAGWVENLQKMVMKVDNCEDNVTKGWTNGEFRSGAFSSFYSLTDICIYNKQEHIVFANAMITVVMARYTELFGSCLRKLTIEDILMDYNIMFIGALMLRMSNICCTNSKRFIDPNTSAFVEDDAIIHIVRNPDAVRGFVMSAYSSLLNHSCNPNVYSVCTDDGKIIYYCALTIPKGSQIFDCYEIPFYSTLPKSERKRRLYDNCQFRCYCEACKENWSSAPYQPNSIEHIEVLPSSFSDIQMVEPIMKRFKKYVDAVASMDLQWITVMSKIVQKDLEILFEIAPYPNPAIISMLYMLRVIVERIYGSTTKRVPHLCIQHFKVQQSHMLKTKGKIGQVEVKMSKSIDNNNDCYEQNNNIVKEEEPNKEVMIIQSPSMKKKSTTIDSEQTYNKRLKLEDKENSCICR